MPICHNCGCSVAAEELTTTIEKLICKLYYLLDDVGRMWMRCNLDLENKGSEFSMPKNDKPHKKHGKTLDDWVAKGWIPLKAAAETEHTPEVPVDHETQVFVLFGQVFDADGNKLKGHDRPLAHIEDTDTGTVVVFSAPLEQDVTLLYKLEPVEVEA